MKISQLALGIFLALSIPAFAQQQNTWFHQVDSDEVRTYEKAPDPSGRNTEVELKSYQDEKRIDENKNELKSYENERGDKENDSDFSDREPDYKSRSLTGDD